MAEHDVMPAVRSNQIACVTVKHELSTAQIRIADVISVSGNTVRWQVPVVNGAIPAMVDGALDLACLPHLPLFSLVLELGRIIDMLFWYRGLEGLTEEVLRSISVAAALFREGNQEIRLAMHFQPRDILTSGVMLNQKKQHIRDGCATLDRASRKLCEIVRASVAAGVGLSGDDGMTDMVHIQIFCSLLKVWTMAFDSHLFL